MNIAIISGSPREGRLSHRVTLHLARRLQQETTHTVQVIDVKEWSLPPVQSSWASLDEVPELYRPLAEMVFEADAFILVSPEYNGGYSPTMKNLLDYFPKQSRKTFGLCTASPGAMGGMRAALQLQLLSLALWGIPSPQMLIVPAVDSKFDEHGNLKDAGFARSIDIFMRDFLWLAEKLTA